MKAVICRHNSLSVQEVAEPKPGPGQVLVEVARSGICGSDLHLREHTDHMKELMDRSGDGDNFPNSNDPLIMGHEFSARLLDYGPGCRKKIKTGTPVVSPPLLKGAKGAGITSVGLSKSSGGAYAERMVLEEYMLLPVPNGLAIDMAALTEPMAVGLHAVNKSKIQPKDVAIVIGCGPVGLAVLSALRARKVQTVIASDFSPVRRGMAKAFGAHTVIDPTNGSVFQQNEDLGFHPNISSLAGMGLGVLETMSKLPIPWWHLWRVGETLGFEPKGPVIFDCVGVPGMHQTIIDGAPVYSRIIVVGVCMGADHYEPAVAINKELSVQYVLGYTPLEYRDTLELIADGKLLCEPMITGVVGLDGVDNAFTALGDPDKHAKILIDPKSGATTPVPR